MNTNSERSDNSTTLLRKALSWVQMLFTPTALAFLAYFVWLARDDLLALLREASLPLLAVAILAWCIFNIVTPLLAVITFKACGLNIPWKQALAVHSARLPARYVPGGVWHTVGRVMDYSQQGVRPRHLTAFVLLENGLAAAVALAVGGATVFVTRDADTLGMIALLSSVVACLALPVMWLVINKRLLQQPERMSFSAFATAVGLMVAIWITATFAFLVYLSAFPSSLGDHSHLELGGIYLFSWGVGFLSIFAPQGIGVFELVSSKLMQSPIGFVGFAALIGGFRFVVLIADLTVWIGYYLLRQRTDRQ
jgi:hypothetical protein